MPGIATGIAEKKASNAASPPADAPIPTIGNLATGGTSLAWAEAGLRTATGCGGAIARRRAKRFFFGGAMDM